MDDIGWAMDNLYLWGGRLGVVDRRQLFPDRRNGRKCLVAARRRRGRWAGGEFRCGVDYRARLDAGRGVVYLSRFDARRRVQMGARLVDGGGGERKGELARALADGLHGLAEHLDQLQIQCRGQERDVRREAHMPTKANCGRRRWWGADLPIKFAK